MLKSCGIIYVATGKKYIAEAFANASISRRFAPAYTFSLITDRPFDATESPFDYVYKHPSPTYSYRDKISGLLSLSARYNLFLDSDAFLVSNPSPLFSASTRFDLMGSYAPVRKPPGWNDESLPSALPEINTGALLLKRTFKTKLFIKRWLKLYDLLLQTYGQKWDQASFRSVLFNRANFLSPSFGVLPSECNLRTTKPWLAGRGLPVFVVHGRFNYDELSDFIHFLNSDIDRFRTFDSWLHFYPDSSIRPRFDRTYS